MTTLEQQIVEKLNGLRNKLRVAFKDYASITIDVRGSYEKPSTVAFQCYCVGVLKEFDSLAQLEAHIESETSSSAAVNAAKVLAQAEAIQKQADELRAKAAEIEKGAE